jgi:patatin-related protein
VSSPEQSAPAAKKPPPPPEVERELRFAIVMYGGVSLAIYINGVTQELLRMVRATARDPDTDKMLFPTVSGTEAVYRDIAKLIDKQARLSSTGDLTRTRFVVDIISGTSAGGINGVFLSKALARNQTMEGLKNLWLEEGDFGKLLNDTKSSDYRILRDRGFAVQRPERSLLNSQRMYRKLLEALEQMGESTSGKAVPLVSEIDLFVTTTDIEGIPLPIQLADRVVYERRYRNVFHFRYATEKATGKKRDDFTKVDDPFLAFAARCTSSFPFAFEAMQLNDIRVVLDRYARYGNDDPFTRHNPVEQQRWDHFIKDYLQPGLIDVSRRARGEAATGLSGTVPETTDDLRIAFRDRSFGDGGYLDNKPFSYATSLLMRRHADCVVERKLLYVEPTPEHPELAPNKPEPRPDFAENVRAAVLDLPRQETIREDIERIDQRNEIIERIAIFARDVDEDVNFLRIPKPLDHVGFLAADLKTMIRMYGVSYGAYHRLKVQEITELLTCMVTRALGYDPASDVADAIRELILRWRRQTYFELHQKKQDGNQPKTENEFLLDYDIHYRLRRLSFLNRRINQLGNVQENGDLDPAAKVLLRAWLDRAGKIKQASGQQPNPQRPQVARKDLARLRRWLGRKWPSSKRPPRMWQTWCLEFLDELNAIKKDVIAERLQRARFTEEQFLDQNSTASDTLRKKIDELRFGWKDLERILSDDESERRRGFSNLLSSDGIKNLGIVAETLLKLFDNRADSGLTIANAGNNNPMNGRDAARLCLQHYYDNFLLYDLVTYAVQYGSSAGEANVVRVYRVSPEDADTLMEERAGDQREKLAGRTMMSFGAFLDRRWRENDMVWGRLDGAERLIAIALPDNTSAEVRGELIFRAHSEILLEEFNSGNADAVCRLLSNARAHAPAGSARNEYVQKLIRALHDRYPQMTDVQRDYLQTQQKFDREVEPESALKYISRSTTITGRMLEGLADAKESSRGKRPAKWLARLGATFWNLIGVAVPQSLASLFFQYWLGLAYLFAAILIFGGIFISDPPLTTFGWKCLGIAVALHFVTFLLTHYMTHGRIARFFFLAAALVVVIALASLGIVYLYQYLPKANGTQMDQFKLGAAAFGALGVIVGVSEVWQWFKKIRDRRRLAPRRANSSENIPPPSPPAAIRS